MKVGEIIGSIVETIIKLGIFVFLGVLIYRGALTAYDYGYRVFTEDPVSVGEGRIISVEVREDMSAKALGEMLQQKGLIRDSRIFILQELLSEYHGDEVPGIYDLSTAMTAEEMLAVISAEPEETEEEEIAIPEVMEEEEELYIAEDEAGVPEENKPIADESEVRPERPESEDGAWPE